MSAKRQTPKASAKKLVESMLERDRDIRERILRSEQAINAICQKERVRLAVTSLHLRDGKLIPQIQLVSLD
jgi:hypothetical protein